MNYISVCSGIEAATVAWHDLGFNPVGFSEIEPFPSALLEHYYPHAPNYGDMTKFQEWNINDTVELIVGGTPCQSFSVAGLREGLDDPRGNLCLTFLAILEKFKPKWFVWENVPGVISSGKGNDFAAFLSAANEIGYSCSWSILDAQFFGVPQRRRRVFVVGYSGDWRCAAKVLFEQEMQRRDIEEIRKTRKASAHYAENGTGRILPPISYACTTSNQRWEPTQETYICFQSNASASHCMPVVDNQVPTLTTNARFMAVSDGYNVRRLTPLECERLQGFPDHYTLIDHKTCSDTSRYKAIGNSMAVPVMRWIGERLT